MPQKERDQNPLKGLRVPSIDEIVAEVVDSFGLATIDLADREQRERFRVYLKRCIGHVLRWRLREPLEKATGRAVQHILELMEDERYQEARALRRKRARELRSERIAERRREGNIAREVRRQERKRLVQ
jgi:hypothetical protein